MPKNVRQRFKITVMVTMLVRAVTLIVIPTTALRIIQSITQITKNHKAYPYMGGTLPQPCFGRYNIPESGKSRLLQGAWYPAVRSGIGTPQKERNQLPTLQIASPYSRRGNSSSTYIVGIPVLMLLSSTVKGFS